MSAVPTDDCWIFVIDTNEYAGKFERQLVAYLTGSVGMCEVGDDEAALFKAECPEFSNFADKTQHVADDNGCTRPASIWRNHEMVYNSVAAFFDSRPTEEEINLMKSRARKWVSGPTDKYVKPFEINGFRLIEWTINITKTEHSC